jgi:hypothetical protein
LDKSDSTNNPAGKKYVFTSPVAVRILNDKYEVKSWTGLLLQVCEVMIKNRSEIVKDFDKNQKFIGKTRRYFSYKNNDLTRAAKQLSNGLWIETNFSSQAIAELTKLIVSECGYSENDIEYFLTLSKPSEKKVQQKVSEKLVKFSYKYSSITLGEDVLRFIFQTIKDIDEQEIYIETNSLLKMVAPQLEQESTYKYSQHPLNNILKFLLDIGAITLYQDAKRGKYVIEDYEIMQKLISDPSVIPRLAQ